MEDKPSSKPSRDIINNNIKYLSYMYDLSGIKREIPIKDLAVRLGLKVRGNAAFCFAHDDESGGKPSLVLGTQFNVFRCHACGENGSSVIDLVMKVRGLSEWPAIQYLADLYNYKPIDSQPNTGSAGLTERGGGGSTSQKTQPTTTKDAKPERKRDTTPVYAPPSAVWQRVMVKHLRSASVYLNHSPEAVEHRKWLVEERGLNEATIKKKLGWVPDSIYWTEENKMAPGEKFRLPSGLVLGCIQDGQLQRIKIRRQASVYSKYYSKYHQVAGSSSVPQRLGDPNSRHAIIVKSDLDGLLLDQEAGDLIQIIALGSATIKPDDKLTASLREKDVILVALDKDKSGIDALPWWLENFKNARRLAPVFGKDPSEDWKAGLNIRAWFHAGIHSCHGEYCENVSFVSDYGKRIEWCNEASSTPQDLLLADCPYAGCPLGKWQATDEEVNYEKVDVMERYRI